MIRLLISVAFAFAVAKSAEAMSPAPLHQPDGMIAQIRKARQARPCDDPNQVRINGICEDSAPHVSRSQHVCVEWNEGMCVEYYGTLAPRGRFVPR
jgi:hypothetical protein